jgi:hypothetical protein
MSDEKKPEPSFPDVTPQKLSEVRQEKYANTVKGKYVTGEIVKAEEPK